jgi:acetyltransferase
MSIRHLDRLLEPASIAVVGASDRPGSVGATVWRNLRAGSFAGPVRAVNLKHAALDGEPVFARPADLPEAPGMRRRSKASPSFPAWRPCRRRPTWR